MRHKHTIIVGLGFGDEGKGKSVAHVAAVANADHVVRFNGGPQAAHHVVNENGDVHCFSQFGAGSLCDTGTLLSRHMFVAPFAMELEAEALTKLGVASPLSKVMISARCRVVTPFHKLINRMQEEARGDARHGSCGLGVGQAFMDTQRAGYPVIEAGDLGNPDVLAPKLRLLWMLKREWGEQLVEEHPHCEGLASRLAELSERSWVPWLVEAYGKFVRESGVRVVPDEALAARWSGDGHTLWEGAQGVLLDAERGFWPHVTPSTTTPDNALGLLAESGAHMREDVAVWGVLRGYGSRHGAGPFVTESPWLSGHLPELHNGKNNWQGGFRVGWFDVLMAKYALGVAGRVDGLVLTQLDRMCGLAEVKLCDGYRFEGPVDSALERHFVLEERKGEMVIKGIKVPTNASREHQSELSQLLAWCRPLYRRLQGWRQEQLDAWINGAGVGGPVETFLETVEGMLGRSIVRVSVGPEGGAMCPRHPHSKPPTDSAVDALSRSVASVAQ